jgi:hypothetical protein
VLYRTEALSPLKDQLDLVKIKSPIEQHMIGHGGLFRQENVEKRRIMSVREWAELCNKDEFRAPGVKDIGLHARSQNAQTKPTRRGRRKVDRGSAEVAEPEVEGGDGMVNDDDLGPERADEEIGLKPTVVSPPNSTGEPDTPVRAVDGDTDQPASSEPIEADASADGEERAEAKAKRVAQTRAAKEASLAERAALDATFFEGFDPHVGWLPPNTSPADYTPEFCQKLERQYWRNCGLGKPPWYGADTQGMPFVA